ncbi:MAG TPA: GNAT family N-acetyltransferase [Patescibacteria group bacterium]|nr:GNAT family N-acetyltransferase [Patescibacteria group bacterium]
MPMKDIIVVINHVQDSYLDPKNPVDVALRQKIYDFVDQIRPHVKGIAWSFAHGTNARNISFDADHERSPAWRPGDIELVNNDGKGLDSGFLQKLSAAEPGAVILAGVYFEACSKGTATTIREALGIPVAVPRDLADAPDPQFAYHFESAAKEMSQAGIDVTATSEALLLQAAQAPYSSPVRKAQSSFQLAPKPDTQGKSFEIRPIRDGDESHVCRLLGGDSSKLDFDDPRHPVNETVALIEASRNPDAKGGGWVAIADGKPVGIITTKNFNGGVSVDEKYRRRGIAEALIGAQEDYQRLQGETSAIAHIDAGNIASIRLHEKLGYQPHPSPVAKNDGVLVYSKALDSIQPKAAAVPAPIGHKL